MSNATIFAGNAIKALKASLSLNGVATVSTDSLDPTTTGYAANIGSLFLRTNGTLYVKTSAGNTGWTPSVVAGGAALLNDANTTFFDDLDNTKTLKFQLSGITTGTLRTITIPDFSSTMVLGTGTSGQVAFWSSGLLTSEAALSPIRGGHGVVNNVASTLTISGAFATTLTISAATSVTLPVAGTLATLAGIENLSNKSISASNASLTRMLIIAGAGATDGFVELARQTAVVATPTTAMRLYNANDDHISWIKGDGFVRKLADSATASRTWTLPDSTGTISLIERAETFSGAKTLNAALIVSTGGGSIQFFSGSNTATVNAPSVTTNYSVIWPGTTPAVNDLLTVGSGGQLLWSPSATGGPITYTAGENLAIRDAVYMSRGTGDSGRTQGLIYKVDATVASRTEFIGFATATVLAAASVTIRNLGEYAGFSGLSPGSVYYADNVTPGLITSSRPVASGSRVIPVGTASTSSTLIINRTTAPHQTLIHGGQSVGATLSVGTLDSQSLSLVVSGSELINLNATRDTMAFTTGGNFALQKTDTGLFTISGGIASGAAGDMRVATQSASTTAGNINITVGNITPGSGSATGGHVTLQAGGTTAPIGNGGEIFLRSGSGPAGEGAINFYANGGVASAKLSATEFKIGAFIGNTIPVRLYDSSTGQYVGLTVPAGTSTYTIALPAVGPLAGSALAFTSAGTYAWRAPGQISYVAGEALTAGQFVYMSRGTANGDTGRTQGQIYKADAANDSRIDVLGVVITSVSAAATVSIQPLGESTGYSGLTQGQPVYLSVTVPGAPQVAVPTGLGQWIVPIGMATTSTVIALNPGASGSAIYIENDALQTFAIANSVVSPTAVTGLLLNGAAYKGAFVHYAIDRSTASNQVVETGEIRASYKSSTTTWIFDNTNVSDAGVAFTINSSGQVLYTSTTVAGTSYVGTMTWNLETM